MINFSIIKKSQLEGATRLDAEYYQPEFLSIFQKLHEMKMIRLGDFCNISDGDHAKMPELADNRGKRYLRAKDLQNFFINDSDPIFVSEKYFNKLKRSHIKPLDIVLSIMGTIGNIAIVSPIHEIMTANRAVSIISPKDQNIFSSYFIITYLVSKYGAMQRERESMGGVQLRINLDDLRDIKIPSIAKNEQSVVDNLFCEAIKQDGTSKLSQQCAENLILEEMGLEGFKNNKKLFSVVNLSEMEDAKRIDAEYFQAKYAEVINKIEKYRGGCDFVRNQFKQNKKIEKKDQEFYNYIEIRDVNVSSGEITPTRISSTDIPANGKIKLSKYDLLISKVRPYRGAVSIIDFEMDNLLGSGAFTVLQEKTGYKKEVLMAFLKTAPIKSLLLRYNCGTSYPVIKDEDILNLKIPILPQEIQEKISELVKQSHEARKKSKELLEEAKRKVEEMIERGGEEK